MHVINIRTIIYLLGYLSQKLIFIQNGAIIRTILSHETLVTSMFSFF